LTTLAFGEEPTAINVGTGRDADYELGLPEMFEFEEKTFGVTACEAGVDTITEIAVPILTASSGSFEPFLRVLLQALRVIAIRQCQEDEKNPSGSELVFEGVCTVDDPVLISNPFNDKFKLLYVYLDDIPEDQIRTYKIAGANSEYGIGNISIGTLDPADGFFVIGERVDMFVKRTTLEIPNVLKGRRVRVSLKPGTRFTIYGA
jgi:hypothetical protein